jgi:hypothetical protein
MSLSIHKPFFFPFFSIPFLLNYNLIIKIQQHHLSSLQVENSVIVSPLSYSTRNERG